jgi:hypothetical protein
MKIPYQCWTRNITPFCKVWFYDFPCRYSNLLSNSLLLAPPTPIGINKTTDGETAVLDNRSATTARRVGEFIFTASSNYVDVILIQMWWLMTVISLFFFLQLPDYTETDTKLSSISSDIVALLASALNFDRGVIQIATRRACFWY